MSEVDYRQKFDDMLEEAAKYEVTLEPDPTLPHLGNIYLQRVLSQCRNYQNRVAYYMTEVKKVERHLRQQLSLAKTDLELKVAEKLADDSVVRKQPSIEDRKALALTLLRQEHETLGQLQADIQGCEDTWKILRMKYEQLKSTSADIKVQRAMVRDDKYSQMAGEEGYVPPTKKQDGSIPGGLPAPVAADDLNPTDLLDPEKRPEDMPAPKDAVHAEMIANFFGKGGRAADAPPPARVEPPPVPKEPDPVPEQPVNTISYSDLL